MFNVLFVIVLVWGLALRLMSLPLSIDYDEAYSFLYFMKQNFLVAIGHYSISNNHLLNSFLGWGVEHLVTPVPSVLRFLPFLTGCACVYVIFAGLKVFFDRRTAALASMISWMTVPFVIYSASARGYIFMVFFFFLGLMMYNRKKENGATFCWALAIWAVPTGLHPFLFSMIALYFVNKVPWQNILRLIFKTGLITIGLYLPAIIYVILFGTKIFTTQEPISLEFYLRNFLKTYSFLWLPGLASLLFFVPLLTYFHPKAPSTERRLIFVLSLFVGLMIASQRSALEYERLWIWTIPFLLGLLLKLLDQDRMPMILRKYGFLIFLFPLMVVATQKTGAYSQPPETNVKALYQDLKTLMSPGDFFLIRQSTVTLVNYWEAVESDRRIQDFQPFFISGDWKYSLYRSQGPISFLKEKIGKGRFFAVIEDDREIAVATQLVSEFVGRPVIAEVKSFPHFRLARLAVFTIPPL